MRAYDAVVIGAGPAGMTAALYLCRSGVRTALVESLTPGGQLLKTSEISNYPGFPDGAEGWSLADSFAKHIEPFALDRYTEPVLELTPAQGGEAGARHLVRLGAETLEAPVVIVCSGAAPRQLGLADEGRLTGHGVSYCAMCDGMFFRDQLVAMVGGGNAALEEALYLSNLVKKLYLIHRRDAFRAEKVYQDKIFARADKIELVLSHKVSALHGDKELTGVSIAPVAGGPERVLDVTGLFVFVGLEPHSAFFPSALQTDERNFVVTDTEMRTNIPGIFAAGDIRAKLCRQVATAVGDGATAAHAAFAYLEQLEV